MSDVWQQFAEWEKSESFTPRKRHLLPTDDEDMIGAGGRLWPGPDSSNDGMGRESEDESRDGYVGSVGGVEAEGKEEISGDSTIEETQSQLSPTLRPSTDSIESYGVEGGTLIDIQNSDLFEEFAVDSGSEKEFLIANLQNHAPVDEVEKLKRSLETESTNVLVAVGEWNTQLTQDEFEEPVRTARVSDRAFSGENLREFKFLQNATSARIDGRICELVLDEQDENEDVPLPSIEYPAPHLVLRKNIEAFAMSHMFSVNKHIKPTTLQRREFTRDVYDYARALGMGKHQAEIEVARAKAAYRQERGLTGGLRIEESDDESTLGLEINDMVEYITSMKNGMQRGPIDPDGAWQEIIRLQTKASTSKTPTDGKGGDRVSGKEKKPLTKKQLWMQKWRRDQNLQKEAKEEGKINRAVHTALPEASLPGDSRTSKKRKRSSASKISGTNHNKSAQPSPYFVQTKVNTSTQSKRSNNGEIKPVEAENVSPLTTETHNVARSNQENHPSADLSDRRPRKKRKRSRKKAGDTNASTGKADGTAEMEFNGDSLVANTQDPDTGSPRVDKADTFKQPLLLSIMKDGRNRQDIVLGQNGTQPLLELSSTNVNVPKAGRRNRESRRKAIPADSKAASSQEVTAAKDYHS